jgi:hypothetical protein
MIKARTTLAVIAICAAVMAGAAATAAIQSVPRPTVPNMPPNFGLFVANQPTSSNRVGIFVARRQNGMASLYYCSSPADANSKDPSGCKEIQGFPK